MNWKNKVFFYLTRNWLIVLLLSFFSIVPIIFTKDFNMGWDGVYHFNRFESIYIALKHGSFPSIFNFTSPADGLPFGIADNGFYPWLVGLIFIIPRLLGCSALLSLYIGFFLLNFITIYNTKLLVQYLTKKRLLIWFGVIIYQFNNFHFIDLYSRTAMGESFGYAFFPLVILGLLKINDHKKDGFLILGFGMGMLMNSHLLTLIFAVLFIIVFEIIQLLFGKLTVEIIFSFFKAAIISISIGCYSIFNVLYLSLTNKVQAPFRDTIPVFPVREVAASLANDLNEYISWSYGLPVLILQIILTVFLFRKENINSWKNWILSSNLIMLSLLNWWPWKWLKNSPISVIQFLSRLEIIVLVLLVVGCVKFFTIETYWNRKLIIFLSFSFILCSVAGSYKVQNTYNSSHSELTNHNYSKLITTSKNPDYIPASVKVKELPDINEPFLHLSRSGSNYVEYIVKAQDRKIVKLPVVLYNKCGYRITVDGEPTGSLVNNSLEIALNTGTHIVKVQNKQSLSLLLFSISTLSFLSIFLVFLKKYFLKNNRKNLV